MNVNHLLYQINIHHLVSQMFFLDARNHALFSLTQWVTCHAYITYIAADKVARVCTTNITKTANIVFKLNVEVWLTCILQSLLVEFAWTVNVRSSM